MTDPTAATGSFRRAAKSCLGGLAVFASGALVALSLTAVNTLPAAASNTTTTITAEGETAYNVPSGATSLEVVVIGAQGSGTSGGGAPVGTGGQGAEVSATISVPNGVSTLYVEVGASDGSGGAGTSDYGGYGGGESAIQTCAVESAGCEYTASPSSDPRLVVAGGGGGGGEDTLGVGSALGGAGGAGGGTSSVGEPGAGGNGNDSGNGGAGGSAGFENGASAAAVGIGSTGCGAAGDGTAGSAGQGGTGGTCDDGADSSGGGGGAGWVGGSGGGAGDYAGAGGAGGGGGAGSSFVESSATDVSIASAGSGAPEVEITPVAVAPDITSAAATTFTVGQAGSFTVTATGVPAAPALSDGSTRLPSGVSFTDNGDGTATIAGTPAAGCGGLYHLTITASNGVSPVYNQSFTLTVLEAPDIASAAITTFTTGQTGTFTVTTTGYPAPSLNDGGATLPSGVSFVNGNGTARLSGTPASGTGGSYDFTITASNGVGASATQNFTLVVDQAPAITSAAADTFLAGEAGSFTIETTGYPNASLSDAGASLPSGLRFLDDANGTATISGTPAPGSGGSYPLTITATNGTDPNATQGFTLTIDESPGITSAAGTTFVVGRDTTFTVITDGYPHASLSDGGARLPSEVSFSDNGDGTATISGTPAAGSGGSYPFTITATSETASPATQAFTLTVDQSPSFTSAAVATFVVGKSGQFTVGSSGFPAPTLSVGGAKLPSGVSFVDNRNGTATISGKPAAGSGGSYPFTITATSGTASPATQAFTLTVDQSPSFTSAAVTTFVVGKSGQFTVGSSGFPAPTLSVGGAKLPSGVSFVDNRNGTATISGKPAVHTAGRHELTITAGNGTTPAATQSFTLVVDQAPLITSGARAAFVVGRTATYRLTATGFPTASALRISDQGARLPAGLSFGDKGAVASISGTPKPGTAGMYRLTLRASNGVSPAASQVLELSVDNLPGYVVATATGAVRSFGAIAYHGSASRLKLAAPVVGVAALPSGRGYWLAGANGAVYAFGSARQAGSLTSRHLRVGDIVAIVSTPDGGGYWLVSRAGAVYAFGDARYLGDLPSRGVHLNDVVAMAPTRDAKGYYLASATGSVYCFGDAVNHGRVVVRHSPVVAIGLDWATGGYWLAESNGVVLGRGAPSFRAAAVTGAVVGLAASADAEGYYLATPSRVLRAGDARKFGSGSTSSVVAISSP